MISFPVFNVVRYVSPGSQPSIVFGAISWVLVSCNASSVILGFNILRNESSGGGVSVSALLFDFLLDLPVRCDKSWLELMLLVKRRCGASTKRH